MRNFSHDQAAGLRRLMQGPKPRIISVLSASNSEQQARLMTNLAASIQHHGGDVLLVHAGEDSREARQSYEVDQLPSLLDVVHGDASLDEALRTSSHGYAVSKLLPRGLAGHTLNAENRLMLDAILGAVASERSVLLVDAVVNDAQQLPVDLLNRGEIMVQMSTQADSIKQAYSLIKQLHGQLGRRAFGILVNNATQSEAETVYRNIGQVARRYLGIELEFIGAIPADEHLRRAARLGRAVIDAFPMASASSAFKALATRIDYRQAFAAAPTSFV